MSVNKVILVGNVGRDPEVRYLDNNTPVASFSLATSETYKNKNGDKVTNTEWHNIVLWRGLAQVAEKYVKKGSLLYLEGRIKTRAWDDKEGNKRYTTEVVADNMQMLGGRSDDNNRPQYETSSGESDNKVATENTSTPDSSGTDDEVDDLPF